MKKNITLLLMVTIFLLSCNKDKVEGNGPITTETRDVNNFYSVTVSGSSKVFITQGNNFTVQVKAYQNLLPYLNTVVQDGALKIGYKPNSNINNDNSEITITMPSLTGITLEGDGEITTKGQFIGAENFVINASGAGSILMESGSATNLRVTVYGVTNVKTFGFPVNTAEVETSGSGNVEVNVANTLNATINGSGNIYYKGAAQSITTKIAGSGKVINVN